jgi:hypothetical protein
MGYQERTYISIVCPRLVQVLEWEDPDTWIRNRSRDGSHTQQAQWLHA